MSHTTMNVREDTSSRQRDLMFLVGHAVCERVLSGVSITEPKNQYSCARCLSILSGEIERPVLHR